MSNLLKFVEMNDGTILEIADKYARETFIRFILVSDANHCPDTLVWVNGGSEEQGKLSPTNVSDEDKNALYIIPVNNVKGEESGTDNDYIEYYIANNRWERLGGTIHTVEDKYVRPLDSAFDENSKYFVNDFKFIKTESGDDVYKLVIGARNYEEDVLKTFKRG